MGTNALDQDTSGIFVVDEKNPDEMELYCDHGGGKGHSKEIKYDVMSYKMPPKISTKAARKKKKYSLMK